MNKTEKGIYKMIYWSRRIFSNNLLNVIFGLTSGIMINIITAPPVDKRYTWPVLFFVIFTVAIILMSILNQYIDTYWKETAAHDEAGNTKAVIGPLKFKPFFTYPLLSLLVGASFLTAMVSYRYATSAINKEKTEVSKGETLIIQKLTHLEKKLAEVDSLQKVSVSRPGNGRVLSGKLGDKMPTSVSPKSRP